MGSRLCPMVLACAVLACSAGAAGEAEFHDVTVAEIGAALEKPGGVFLLNPLSDLEFNDGHIPGSVNIPLHLIPTSDALPADKGHPIITYCLGPK